jgi:hypothetical protein
MKVNWGTGLAAVYILFAVGTLGVVAFAVAQPADLVSADYYSRSLQHDSRMEAERNGRALEPLLTMAVRPDRSAIELTLPPATRAGAQGTVTLYRPSDAAADRMTALAVDTAGRQAIDLASLPSGVWRVRLEWTGGGAPYFVERMVHLP